jgi:tetratricopeptide (TPR) repeat protein
MQVDTNEPLNATNDFPTAPQPQSPAADVLLALSRYDAAIEELRQATRLPHSRYPHNYDANPLDADQGPALTSLSQCILGLRLRAVAELENGQNENALDDIKLIFYLANSLRDEPFLTSHLVRASFINFALQPIWEGLHDRTWSDPQLVFIERELAQFDMLSDYQFSVRADRSWKIATADYNERSRSFPAACAAFFSDPDDNPFNRDAIVFYLMLKGWFYQNDLAIAQTFQQSLETNAKVGERMLPREIAERSERAVSIGFKHHSPCNFLASMVSRGFSVWMRKCAFVQSSLDKARVACALERYRLAHGEYPATLDLLSPQFIDKLPHDIINDQPLHYRRTDDGLFLLYSVGWNETDDGEIVVRMGNLYGAKIDMDKGDWVWPCRPIAPPPSPPRSPEGARSRYLLPKK